MILLHTIFSVYDGDPGFLVAFLILYLDLAIIRMAWRIVSSLFIIAFYIILTLANGLPASLTNIAFLSGVFISYLLAVHGQEHFSHVSDYERRNLEVQTKELEDIKRIKWQLLSDLLPEPIARQLLNNGSNSQLIAHVYEDVTVLFTDMKGFTAFSSKLDPSELASFLNGMFSAFDEILQRWGLHKVEVIGDAYFVVSGAPELEVNKGRTPAENAAFAAEAALGMVLVLNRVCEDKSVRIRVGLHSGSVVGGVVGLRDPRFHLFGRTVDLANRMEEFGEPDRVHLSHATHRLLTSLEERDKDPNGSTPRYFSFDARGPVEIPAEPEPINTYFLNYSSFDRKNRARQRAQKSMEQGALYRASSARLSFNNMEGFNSGRRVSYSDLKRSPVITEESSSEERATIPRLRRHGSAPAVQS